MSSSGDAQMIVHLAYEFGGRVWSYSVGLHLLSIEHMGEFFTLTWDDGSQFTVCPRGSYRYKSVPAGSETAGRSSPVGHVSH